MTSQEKEINSGGSGYALVGSGVKGVNVNGFAVAAETGGLGDESSVGSSGDDLGTYTRRKRVKVVKDDGKVTWCSTSQVTNKVGFKNTGGTVVQQYTSEKISEGPMLAMFICVMGAV